MGSITPVMARHDELEEAGLEDIVNIDDEIREWEEKCEEEPANDKILAKLSDLYKERSDQRRNDIDKAKEYAQEAVKHNKDNISGLTNLGYFAYLRDYDWFGCDHLSRRAGYYLRKAIRAGERNGLDDVECMNIAELALCLGKKEIAEEYTDLSLRKNLGNVDAQIYRIGKIRQEDPIKAEEEIRKILKLQPTHLDLQYQYANLLFDNKRFEEYKKRKEYVRAIAERRGLTAPLLMLFS